MIYDNHNSDKGWSYPPSFLPGKQTTRMVMNEEDIRQSLIILLSTRIGERVHRPDYGTELYLYQFEQMDLTVETQMKRSIEKAILLFEPRITLDRIEISQEPTELGILDIWIFYRIRTTDSQQELVYPFAIDPNR